MASQNAAETLVREMFGSADVTIDGNKPGDIQVKDPRFYGRFVREASMGLGESYIDGWWECEALDTMIEKLLRANLRERLKGNWHLWVLMAKAMVSNMQRPSRAAEVAEAHYDLGNDLYEAMLDKRMMYTCAYFKDTDDLAVAQEKKLDLIFRKAGLQPGMKVLDLGCGWGGAAAWAAEKYGCEVTGISISKEQIQWAKEHWKGLKVDYRLGDYREITGVYDAVYSIGLLEHIGFKNYRTFMEVVNRSLKKDGVAVLHTIGNNISRYHADPFVQKYVFPNAMSPSLAQLAKAFEGLFICEDMQNIGEHYDPTLLAWWKNFDAAWPRLKGPRYNDRFYRMWRFYLLGAAGLSRCRDGQLYQFVITKTGRKQPDCRVS